MGKDSKCKGPNLEMNLVCLRTRKSVRLLWEVKPRDTDEVGKDQMLQGLVALGVPWIPRRLNQLILKKTNPEYSLEGLKLQSFGHLMQRPDSLEKTLVLGKIEGRRRRG